MDSLEEVAHELYGLLPGDFTAARNQRASDAGKGGDRPLGASIRRLAKPSVAAWAVNALVRHRADEVDDLLELGERLRTAQDELDRDAIQSLGRDRQRSLAAIGRSARTLGDELGVPVSESAAIEVQQTLQAAMGDPAAAAAVQSGMLVRTFAGSGLDPVDLEGAVALPTGTGDQATDAAAFDEIGARRRLKNRASSGGSSTRPTSPSRDSAPAWSPPDDDEKRADRATREQERADAREAARTEALAAARQEAEETRQDAEDADAEVATLDLRIRDLVEQRDRLSQELRDLKDQVEAVQDELAETESARASARKERLAAQRTADTAERTAARARKRLDGLER
ncbi:hypothetical protein [Herbiconiux daphne]|uniref:Transposase n=1 Tax=Herbiconiux daphne TaxID=2970914 RepID=A0ABT2H6F5_9MICO|nr:hypothetical protein [Herbiconiux daphne]MCS5735492.1 hypothetical protein [Herbiconiux daphne]